METDYKQLFSLSGKNALVTGAAGILGRRFCEGLAEYGANIAMVDIKSDQLEELAKRLGSRYGVKAIGIPCDVSDPVQVAEMAERAADELGVIHVLHNNAASKADDLEAFFAPFEDYSIDEWRRISSVNIDGMFLVAQAVGKKMAHQEGGSIIQTSSIYGVVAPDQRIYEGSSYLGRQINTPAVYAVTKSAVVGLTRYLAAYWAPSNIRVNCITPGGVESGQNEIFIKKYSQRVPLGRMARSDEMVGALLYLASDASSYVTGQNLIIDGGLTIW